jgi:hypothetical protein
VTFISRFALLFWTIFSSTKTAICIIILLGVMLGFGTIVESRHNSNDYAQIMVYHTWWYQGCCLLFLVNLICGTLKKWPWKLSQIPWLCTHLSILLIFFGAALTHLYGENGILQIPEGESLSTYTLKDHLLEVHFTRDRKVYHFPTHFHVFLTNLKPDQVFEIPEKNFKLKVTTFLPFPAQGEHFVENLDTQAQTNPALHLKFQTPISKKEVWLLAQDPQKYYFPFADFHVVFQTANTEQIKNFKEHLDTQKKEHQDLGTLQIHWDSAGTTYQKEIVLTADLLQKEIPFGDYSLQWLDYWPEMGIHQGEYYLKGLEPKKPAMQVQIKGPKGLEYFRVLEADAEHCSGKKDYQEVRLKYLPPKDEKNLQGGQIVLLKNQDFLDFDNAHEGIWAFIWTRFNEMLFFPLDIAKEHSIPKTGFSFELLEVRAKAKPAQKIYSSSYSLSTTPAIAFEVEGVPQEPHDPHFVVLGGMAKTLNFKGNPVKIRYIPHQKSLDFSLKLNRFLLETYEGTDKPKGFKSQVTILENPSETMSKAPQEVPLKNYDIFMNNTLDHKGFRFFQSAYQKLEDGRYATILEVNRDPGYPFLALGWTLMSLSMLALYYIKPYLVRIENRRKAPVSS